MFALQTLAFPPKEWGRGTEPSTVDTRKGALGKWTNEILNGSANDLIADPAIEKELLMFLAPSEGDDDAVASNVYAEVGVEPSHALPATPPSSPFAASSEGAEYAAAQQAAIHGDGWVPSGEWTPTEAQHRSHIATHLAECHAAGITGLQAHLARHRAAVVFTGAKRNSPVMQLQVEAVVLGTGWGRGTPGHKGHPAFNTGQATTVQARSSDTVGDVKKSVAEKGIAAAPIKLLVDGKPLLDDAATLEESGVTGETPLQVQAPQQRVRGSVGA